MSLHLCTVPTQRASKEKQTKRWASQRVLTSGTFLLRELIKEATPWPLVTKTSDGHPSCFSTKTTTARAPPRSAPSGDDSFARGRRPVVTPSSKPASKPTEGQPSRRYQRLPNSPPTAQTRGRREGRIFPHLRNK